MATVCAPAWSVGADVKGSGQIVKTSRSAPGFTGIAVEAPAKVTVVQVFDAGLAESIVIETDHNMIPLLETVVERGQLIIRFPRTSGSITTTVLNVTVTTRVIEKLAVAGVGTIISAKLQSTTLQCSIGGSGDVRIAQLQTDKLRVNVAGSGGFEAAGRAAEVDASIAGSGDIKAGKLAAERISISIAGSGNATVRANAALNVNIVGSGDVAYYGDARVTQALAGSGKVRQLRER
jgi:hypothetical protein